jgi:lipooligosaccharide transport system ATP-binding protein
VAAGPPAQLVAEHAGLEAVEVYGPPAKLAETEAAARAAGLRTRRTGTSIAVLGIDDADGRVPEGPLVGPDQKRVPGSARRPLPSRALALEGERRPANLEDVFVLLTGEEID